MAKSSEPKAFMFADDGVVPNNARLPFLFYRKVFSFVGIQDTEAVVEKAFKSHGWGHSWRNGIYPYVHYHSMIHEVMGVARGRAWVRFGGEKGEEIELGQGDVALLPAGTGHQCLWSSPDLQVIGAYPQTGRFDLCRGSKAEHKQALKSIPNVPLPDTDPVYGKNGPLLRLWQPA